MAMTSPSAVKVAVERPSMSEQAAANRNRPEDRRARTRNEHPPTLAVPGTVAVGRG
jgi:hypothetical protein